MILDNQTLFSDQQAITATADSTNVVQIGSIGNTPGDAGAGVPIPILIQVTEDFDNLTTLTIDVEVDDNDAMASSKIVSTHIVALADLVAGKKINPQYIPIGSDEEYMQLVYTVTGSAPSAGKITAGICMGVQTNA